MVERFPEDASEEEKRFRGTALGQALVAGQVLMSPEVSGAVSAFMNGEANNSMVQQLKGECLIIEATGDAPEDLLWVWEKVVPPTDTI